MHSTNRDDWRTPPEILERIREIGPIALDPCAPKSPDEWIAQSNAAGPGERWSLRGASDGLDYDGNGLELTWSQWVPTGALVFMNPPYGGRKKVINDWIAKAAEEARKGVEVICLVPASTGAQWFKGIWITAQAGCFVEGRLRFLLPGQKLDEKPKGSATFWSFVGYWGARRDAFFDAFDGFGELSRLNAEPHAGAAGIPGGDHGQR